MKFNNDKKRQPAEEETTTKLDKNKQTITHPSRLKNWETNDGKPDCIGLVLKHKLSKFVSQCTFDREGIF